VSSRARRVVRFSASCDLPNFERSLARFPRRKSALLIVELAILPASCEPRRTPGEMPGRIKFAYKLSIRVLNANVEWRDRNLKYNRLGRMNCVAQLFKDRVMNESRVPARLMGY